jgi:hypothetical protein
MVYNQSISKRREDTDMLKITETTAPVPDYTFTVSVSSTFGEAVWTYQIESSTGRTHSGPINGYFTRWGATSAAKRHIKRLVKERSRSYVVTVEV